MPDHEHDWRVLRRHENADRVRTLDYCACGAERYGCLAKRLADMPDEKGNREAWGPVGVQTYSYPKSQETSTT